MSAPANLDLSGDGTHRAGWPVSYGSYKRGCRCAGCAAKLSAYRRAYYEANREKIAARQRAHYRDLLGQEDEAAVERIVAQARAGESCVGWPLVDRLGAAVWLLSRPGGWVPARHLGLNGIALAVAASATAWVAEGVTS